VLKERTLGPQHLHGARWKAREPVESSRLSDQASGELRPEEGGQVRGAEGRGGIDCFLQGAARIGDGPVEFSQPTAGRKQARVRGTETGSGGSLLRRTGGAGVIPGVQLGEVTRHPASETLADQVSDTVEVGPGSDRLLNVDRRVPGRLEGSFGVEEQGRSLRCPVRDGDTRRHRERSLRVVEEAVGSEAPVTRVPTGSVGIAKELLLLGGEAPVPSLVRPFREKGRLGRRPDRLDHHLTIKEERSEPGGDDAFHDEAEAARDK